MIKIYSTGTSSRVRELPDISSDVFGKVTDKIGYELLRVTPPHNGYKWYAVQIGRAVGYIREDVGRVVLEEPPKQSKFTYILDPGHGGINPTTGQYVTPGKRSPKFPDGFTYFEGVGNRDIAKIVGSKLNKLGIKHEYTINPDSWVDTPLTTRVTTVNAIHAKTPSVLISIHSNASGSGTSWHAGEGYEVFTTPGQTKSDEYATIWFEEMAKEFPEMRGRADRSDGDVDKEANFAMLRTKCPAILIEMAFHTNLKEAELLRSNKGKERMADVIVRTIQRIEQLK
jgi:N-acetylmuramoyl-L-alanine amidase